MQYIGMYEPKTSIDYVPNKEYLYLMYWEVNNVYGQAMQ